MFPRLFQKHHSLSYIRSRLNQIIWQWNNPTSPWLTPDAIKFLSNWIRTTDSILEFGSGRSTIWFSNKCNKIISVEHSSKFYNTLKSIISGKGINNIDLFFVPFAQDESSHISRYSNPPLDPNQKFDVVLVDGLYRDSTALRSIELLKPGGILIIDDCHRYLPSSSCSPYAIKLDQQPVTDLWSQFLTSVQSWRSVWYSDGVHDDVFFFKPIDDSRTNSVV